MSDRETIEGVLQFSAFMGFVQPGTAERLLVELAELREAGAAQQRYRDALRTWDDEKAARLDVFRPTFEAHRAKFLTDAGADRVIEFREPCDPKVWPIATEADLDAMLDAARALPKRPPPGTDLRGINMIGGPPARWSDEKSQAQIALYIANRTAACEERNVRNMRNWTEHHRDAWQLHHLGTARKKETL